MKKLLIVLAAIAIVTNLIIGGVFIANFLSERNLQLDNEQRERMRNLTRLSLVCRKEFLISVIAGSMTRFYQKQDFVSGRVAMCMIGALYNMDSRQINRFIEEDEVSGIIASRCRVAVEEFWAESEDGFMQLAGRASKLLDVFSDVCSHERQVASSEDKLFSVSYVKCMTEHMDACVKTYIEPPESEWRNHSCRSAELWKITMDTCRQIASSETR